MTPEEMRARAQRAPLALLKRFIGAGGDVAVIALDDIDDDLRVNIRVVNGRAQVSFLKPESPIIAATPAALDALPPPPRKMNGR